MVARIVRVWSAPGPHVLTLTGLPGVGRARLARHLAQRGAAQLGDVIVIDGPELGDVARLASAVADQAGSPGLFGPFDVQATLSAVPRVLVVIDADRILGLRESLADLVRSCPDLSVLSTAAGPLGLPGERIVRVDSLPSPDPEALAVELRAQPAIQLFLDIAEASGAPVVDDAALADVAAICGLLGGHPMAIELAASRSPVYGPSALRSMLERSSPAAVLGRHGSSSGDGHAPFDAISWAVGLVESGPRRVLGDMTVFRSSVPYEALDSVIGGDALVHDLSLLVDLHLVDVTHDAQGSDYRLHPLVRAAIEHLDDLAPSQRRTHLEDRHLEWAVDVASIAARCPTVTWPTVTAPIERVEADLLAALRRAVDSKQSDAAAQIAAALAAAWFDRGVAAAHLDVMSLVADAVERDATIPDGLRSLVEVWHELLRVERGIGRSAAADVADSVERAVRRVHACDPSTRMRVLRAAVLTARGTGEWDRAVVAASDGVAAAVAQGDQVSQAWFEQVGGMALHQRGDLEPAIELAFTAFERAAGLDAPSLRISTAGFLRTLPVAADAKTMVPSTAVLVREAERVGDRRALLWLRPLAMWDAVRLGDLDTALTAAIAGLESVRASGAWMLARPPTMVVVLVAASRGLDHDVARLHGTLAEHLRHVRMTIPTRVVEHYATEADALRLRLGPAEFDAAAAAGALLAPADATSAALDVARSLVPDPVTIEAPTAEPPALSNREREVAALLATGATNAEIADELFLSPKTVMHHTSSIYRKLGVRGRAEAAAWFASENPRGERRDCIA